MPEPTIHHAMMNGFYPHQPSQDEIATAIRVIQLRMAFIEHDYETNELSVEDVQAALTIRKWHSLVIADLLSHIEP
jgi:hypothetical protein